MNKVHAIILYRLLWLVVALILVGTYLYASAHARHQPPKEHVYVECGKLVDITPTGGEWDETRIETTRGVYFTRGRMSGQKGAEVTIRDDGYLFVDGTPFGFQATGYGG